MGHRLSKIYTRTGDAGTTGLGDGTRTAKNSARVAAMGDVDELNSLLGVILCEDLPAELRELLTGVQHDLFDLGGEISIPGAVLLKPTQPTRLEAAIDRYNADLGPLKEFILPGGTRPAALTHLARTVCRRAERMTVALAAEEAVSRGRAPIPEPPVRPAFRVGALAQPDCRQRRRALAEGEEHLNQGRSRGPDAIPLPGGLKPRLPVRF
jgi:cob(I)alamin adenosyltransferase